MMPTRDQELAVLQSVVYASLFDYPLTLDQLHHALVGIRADQQTIAGWWRSSPFLQAAVEHRDGWYFPAGRRDLIATRARREALSRELLDRDRRILALVSAMPFVRMVALSGSLAHLNAEGSADLDLFVITAPHRVWSVTVAVLLLSRLFGWRRHLCLNYVVSELALKITPKDLFSANQIIHLRPVCGHDTFARFLKANTFVTRYYPNFAGSTAVTAATPNVLTRVIEGLLRLGPAQIAEAVSRIAYRRHLRKKASTWQSREQVRLAPECLKLHTSSHRTSIMARFDRSMVDALHRIDEDAVREVAASRS
jgi:hypothetical protein